MAPELVHLKMVKMRHFVMYALLLLSHVRELFRKKSSLCPPFQTAVEPRRAEEVLGGGGYLGSDREHVACGSS